MVRYPASVVQARRPASTAANEVAHRGGVPILLFLLQLRLLLVQRRQCLIPHRNDRIVPNVTTRTVGRQWRGCRVLTRSQVRARYTSSVEGDMRDCRSSRTTPTPALAPPISPDASKLWSCNFSSCAFSFSRSCSPRGRGAHRMSRSIHAPPTTQPANHTDTRAHTLARRVHVLLHVREGYHRSQDKDSGQSGTAF